jgi:hypothetical protein
MSYQSHVGFDLYRDYDALERPPVGPPDRAPGFRQWAERRQAELARLERSSDYIQGGILRWQALLTLAYLYGWRPLGTELDTANWSRTYFSNDGQLVTAADAAGMADALSKALTSPSPVMATLAKWKALPGHGELFDEPTIKNMAEKLLGSEAARQELRRWMRFFERGSFTIW